jgi:hypothetical protein
MVPTRYRLHKQHIYLKNPVLHNSLHEKSIIAGSEFFRALLPPISGAENS